MKVYENDCCGCATSSYPCLGSACSLRHSPHWYCDECGEEFEEDDLFDTEDGQLCVECASKHLSKYDLEEAVRSTFRTVAEAS